MHPLRFLLFLPAQFQYSMKNIFYGVSTKCSVLITLSVAILSISSCAPTRKSATAIRLNLGQIFDIADSETIKAFQKKMNQMGFKHLHTKQHWILETDVYAYQRWVTSGQYRLTETIEFYMTQPGRGTVEITTPQTSVDYLSTFEAFLKSSGYQVDLNDDSDYIRLKKGETIVVLQTNNNTSPATYKVTIHYGGVGYADSVF
jgi:hypothetical protein